MNPYLGVPVDVVVATQDDIRRFGQKNGTILLPALREGVVIYETNPQGGALG